MSNQDLINKTILFVKEKLANAEGGHDWFHIQRVYKNALLIARGETCDKTVVKLGALLHDIADCSIKDFRGLSQLLPAQVLGQLNPGNLAQRCVTAAANGAHAVSELHMTDFMSQNCRQGIF